MSQNPHIQPMCYYQGMQSQQIKQQMNVLSDEEIKGLMINKGSLLTNSELLQLYCNHKYLGNYSLINDGDEYLRCKICGARIKLLLEE